MDIPQLIRNRRLELGMSRKEFAAAVGVTEATASRWETGSIERMKITIVAKVANVLRVSPLVFLGIDTKEERTVKIPIVGKVVAGTPIFRTRKHRGDG